MALSPRQQRALTNAAVTAGLTALVGLVVVQLMPGGREAAAPASPSSSPSPSVACEPRWEPVDSPDPEDGGSLLLGVAAVGPEDAWAVGGAGDPVDPTATLTIRWNGQEWDVVPSPNPGSTANRFEAVAALSADAAWAVGRASDGAVDHPIAARWDGGDWTLLSLPPEMTEGALMGVAAIQTDDVWAVGYQGDVEAGTERAVALRWDGREWRSAPVLPALRGGRTALLAVAATSRTDAWAVGYRRNEPVILHFDGRAWALSMSQVPGDALGVTALAVEDAWAVGERVQRWDGKGWTQAGTVKARGLLRAVAAVGPSDVWAVGDRPTEASILKPLVQRWDGTGWEVLRGQGVAGSISLTAVSAVPDGTVLAVGYRDGPRGRTTFAIRGTTCAGA
ncbi:MAG TPA: hypothetical protein VFR44_02620 [Actinomycetota bacterium]|nr:hypothetical protein [Actinomycetota bacterium]